MADFIGIGGQRCGTTWLYAHLRRHPNVRFPAGKEVHYWDTRNSEGAKPWLDMFPDAPAGVKQGDITPSYALLSRLVINEVHAAVPDARLFLSIRNPMERALSAALFLLGRCQMDPDEASDGWFVDVVSSWRCRAKSTFSETIDRWDTIWGVDRLHLILYDDIVAQPVSVLRELADHLGIDPGFYQSGDTSVERRQGTVTAGGRVPSDALRKVLYELHVSEIERLEIILEHDFSHWREWAQQ